MEDLAPVNRRRFLYDAVALGCVLLGSIAWAHLSRSSTPADARPASAAGPPSREETPTSPTPAAGKGKMDKRSPNRPTSPKPPHESDFSSTGGVLPITRNLRGGLSPLPPPKDFMQLLMKEDGTAQRIPLVASPRPQ